MKEQELLNAVIELAHLYGWLVAHFRPAQTMHGWRTAVSADGAGFPDCVMVHKESGRVIYAELKSEEGKVSPEQQIWLETLAGCPRNEVYLWRPSDLDEIAKVLSYQVGEVK